MRPHTARMVLQFATDASSSAASEAATSTNADAVETGDAAARKVCRINQASEEHVPGLSTFLVNEEYLTGLDGAVPGYIFSGVQQVGWVPCCVCVHVSSLIEYGRCCL